MKRSYQHRALDVLAIDAFSGGAVPVHLLTCEAIELYLRHLRPGGILAIDITNVYLDLGPIVEDQARRITRLLFRISGELSWRIPG